MNDLLLKLKEERGLDVPIHVGMLDIFWGLKG